MAIFEWNSISYSSSQGHGDTIGHQKYNLLDLERF